MDTCNTSCGALGTCTACVISNMLLPSIHAGRAAEGVAGRAHGGAGSNGGALREGQRRARLLLLREEAGNERLDAEGYVRCIRTVHESNIERLQWLLGREYASGRRWKRRRLSEDDNEEVSHRS